MSQFESDFTSTKPLTNAVNTGAFSPVVNTGRREKNTEKLQVGGGGHDEGTLWSSAGDLQFGFMLRQDKNIALVLILIDACLFLI